MFPSLFLVHTYGIITRNILTIFYFRRRLHSTETIYESIRSNNKRRSSTNFKVSRKSRENSKKSIPKEKYLKTLSDLELMETYSVVQRNTHIAYRTFSCIVPIKEELQHLNNMIKYYREGNREGEKSQKSVES